MAAFVAGLGIAFGKSGWRVFSPGKLSQESRPGMAIKAFASHADFERRCDYCHQPLAKKQSALCLACHDDVQAQTATGSLPHGKLGSVEACYDCHPDHRGTDFDMLRYALDQTDHESARFSLERHQVDAELQPIECSACHTLQGDFYIDSNACIDCHASTHQDFKQTHLLDYGSSCLDCHDGRDRMQTFDHNQTRFPLDGKHQEAKCTDCHPAEPTPRNKAGTGLAAPTALQDTPSECARCHPEPELHLGEFSQDCAQCHTTQAWSPANFQGGLFAHNSQERFVLGLHQRDYQEQPITCKDCHADNFVAFDQQICRDCHSAGDQGAQFIPEHTAKYNPDCLACHDGADKMHDFQHEDVFPLEGKHADLACEGCHVEHQFAETPQECAGCHAEPELHQGFFGLECRYCHSADAWSPAPLRFHLFPLNHGAQNDSQCQVCHPSNRTVETTCYGCHAHVENDVIAKHIQAGMDSNEINDCQKCHPNGT
jgi:hypothetical protein